MKLSNSIKLAMANFSLFWKVLVYKIFAVGIIVLLLLPIFSILNNCLIESGFFTDLSELFSESVFQNLAQMSLKLFGCAQSFASAIIILSAKSIITLIYLIFIIFIFAPFILKLSDLPASESVYSYMASLSRNSFTVNFLDSLGKSVGYAILKTLIEIPFWVLFCLGVYGILALSGAGLPMQIICPLFLFVFVVFMLDIKTTMLNGWAPSVVVFNTCAGKSFKKGLVAVRRKFLSTLSSFAVITTIGIGIICMFGIYSLIILIPLSSLITTVFGQVLFFESQGMNYYVSPDRIIMPRKLEQADSIKKVKSII